MNPNNNNDDLPPTYEQSIAATTSHYNTFSSNASPSFDPDSSPTAATVPPIPSAPPAYIDEPRFSGAYNNGRSHQGTGTTLHEIQHMDAKQEQYNIKHGISSHPSLSSSSSPEGQPHRRTRTRYQPYEYVDQDGMTKTFISPNTSIIPAVPPVCRETSAESSPRRTRYQPYEYVDENGITKTFISPNTSIPSAPPTYIVPPVCRETVATPPASTSKPYRYENECGELDSYVPSQPIVTSYHTDPMEAESIRRRDPASCSCCNGQNEMTSDEQCEEICKCVGVTLCVVCTAALCVLAIVASSSNSSSSHHHHHHSDIFCCWNINTGPIVSGQPRHPVYRCSHGHICTNTHHRHNNQNDCC